jgi:hypothetical protein
VGQYLIEGADKSTGEDRTIIIEANSEADARAKAATMGILVSQVKPWPRSLSEPVPVSYETPSQPATSPKAPPAYLGLKIASFVLGVSCLFFYVGPAILVVQAIMAMNSSPQPAFVRNPAFGAGVDLAAAFSAFAAGAIQHGLSTGCIALRDIAKNTFHK